MKRSIGFICSFLALFVLWSHPVHAIGLQPAIIELSADPGQTIHTNVELTNDESVTKIFYSSIQKFIAKGQDGRQEFLPLKDQEGLPGWISIPQTSYIITPGETRKIPIEIKVLSNAEPGGYYAALFFSSYTLDADDYAGQTPDADDLNQGTVGLRVGSLIFFTVDGAVRPTYTIRAFALDQDPTGEFLPAVFHIYTQNDGKVHVIPRGQIVITDMLGRRVATLPVNGEGGRLMPHSIREFDVTWWITPPLPGSGFFHHVIEELRNFAFGTYKAQLQMDGATPPANPDILTEKFAIRRTHYFIFVVVGVLVLWALVHFLRRPRKHPIVT